MTTATGKTVDFLMTCKLSMLLSLHWPIALNYCYITKATSVEWPFQHRLISSQLSVPAC